jgi:porin
LENARRACVRSHATERGGDSPLNLVKIGAVSLLNAAGRSRKSGEMSMITKFVACAAVSMLWSVASRAGAPQPFSEDLTLDWNGFRSTLRDEGFDFRIGYISETATNVRGGDKELWRYADQWTFATTLDLQKLIGLKDAQFQITITDRNGRNLNNDAKLGSLEEVQEIYGRGQTWHWTEFWYDQQFLDGRLDWKVGRFSEGNDFAAFSCDFMNLTFCGAAPGNIAISYWYNWPIGPWGTRLKATFAHFGYVQLGAFETNANYLLTRNGLNLGDPAGATGVVAPVEVGWLPRFFAELDGSYKFGAWFNSSRVPDAVSNTMGQPLALAGGQPLMHNGEYGAYINFLQRLTVPPIVGSKKGLSAFLNATFVDRRTATIDNQIATGIFYTGPIPSRPDDNIGIAVGRTHVNSRVAAMEALNIAASPDSPGVQHSEYVGEIFYCIHTAEWLELRPNVQYIHEPGGIAQQKDDVIAGLKLAVNF